MNKEAFKQAGMTDGEIKVYLAMLEIGESTTGPIIEKSGIARSISYQILERLIEKGLASFIIKNNTRYYQAANPEKIVEYSKKEIEKAKENLIDIEKILPDLLEKQKTNPKSQATIYLGYKGIRTAHEGTYSKLKKGGEYLYLGVPAYQPDEQHIYWQKDHIRRAKAGINVRILCNKDVSPETLKNRNSYKGCDARYMETDVKTPAGFEIYADTIVIILQTPQQIAVEIVNQDIADSFKAYFEDYWKKSKPFHK